jgi:hypothetical protein
MVDSVLSQKLADKVFPFRVAVPQPRQGRKIVARGTDALASYDGLEAAYRHQVVDHAIEYVRGRVHTNGLENFWSLLKRGIKGTYVSVQPFHLARYLDEQAFRYNYRKGMNDGDRFDLAVRQIVGRRLTYVGLTGNENARA